jgi:predicted NAD/FAD-binding protein
VAVHLLAREHETTMFEAADYLGGHTNRVPVDTPNQAHNLDTGFIVFNDRNYPNFERLLAARASLGGDEAGPGLGHWVERQRFSRRASSS